MAKNTIESEFQTSNMANWSEMARNPKRPTAAILSKISKKIKIPYLSKMARNAIESEFRTSKMADGRHFVKILPPPPKKVTYWSKMTRNAIESEEIKAKSAFIIMDYTENNVCTAQDEIQSARFGSMNPSQSTLCKRT